MKTRELRQRFLEFFQHKGHTVVKSDSLIPVNDPTLLFTGAGMNQFKDYFLGVKTDLKRAVSSQKCLRTADLDLVGKTPYHHSFFEMLGNFSFGDYFKQEAIEWAWEFLTDELKIPRNRLYVSVHEKDNEALCIWSKVIGIPRSLIAQLGDDTNFWPADAPKVGPNGPCGPCSEIFIDQGKDYPGHRRDGFWARDDSGRYAEVWNLVFTQFERESSKRLLPLKSKNIDTGMGLERLACVLQRKQTNFEVDLFVPLVKYLRTKMPRDTKVSPSDLYAIADHVRACVMAISDGAHPSNESRGYVVRKLLRRAIWKGRMANLKLPLLAPMVPIVIETLEDTYPELRQAEKSVSQTIRFEEERFQETLESGMAVVTQLIQKASKRKQRKLSGQEVFQLYDTFGFPDELTRTLAREARVSIDEKGFASLLQAQRQRAKESRKIEDRIFVTPKINQEVLRLQPSKFLGYETTEAKGHVGWANFSGEEGVVALDQTPFYPEGGGQVGDTGFLEGEHFKFQVKDTQKKEGVILHYGVSLKGRPQVNDACRAAVDQNRREATKRNHTATHLLQSALRTVLGTHVRQVGSLVNPEKLRFDFTHGKPLTEEEIRRTEEWVNQTVLDCVPVEPKDERYEDAIKAGALAFFGDKYTDKVRTINIGDRSKELCGGTHCQNTGEIGGFVITTETSIGSGTRRIEAMTGLNTIEYLRRLQKHLRQASSVLKVLPEQLSDQIEKLYKKVRQLEHSDEAGISVPSRPLDPTHAIECAQKIGSVQFIRETVFGFTWPALRNFADQIRSKTKRTVLALFSKQDSKVHMLIALTKDLWTTKLDAKELAQTVAPHLEGSAGGRKDLAQGGGRNANGIEPALEMLVKLIRSKVN